MEMYLFGMFAAIVVIAALERLCERSVYKTC